MWSLIQWNHTYTTFIEPAFLKKTQWAAVTTHSFEIKDPPQNPLLLYFNSTCHGHAPFLAVVPAITRPAWKYCLPQSKRENRFATNTIQIKIQIKKIFFVLYIILAVYLDGNQYIAYAKNDFRFGSNLRN